MGLEGKSLSKEEVNGVEKFCKYAWHGVIYWGLFVWGLLILMEETWSPILNRTIDTVWIGYPHEGHEKPAVKAFMMAQVHHALLP